MKRYTESRKGIVLVSSTALLVTWSEVAKAQERIWYADGVAQLDRFGNSVEIVNNVDVDGLQELLIGADAATCTLRGDGTASVFSINGGELQRWCGDDEEQLGNSVCGLMDVDGDGLPDFVFGAPSWNNPGTKDGAGRFLIVSSATGTTLLEVDGTEPNGRLGAALAGLVDLNADGFPEVLASEPLYAYASPYEAGRVRVYSGKDGSILREYIGEVEGALLGNSLAALGDVDGDGVNDYGMAAYQSSIPENNRGKVYVYSGTTGALLKSWKGEYDWDYLGISLSDAGDIDGDGRADVLCGGLRGPKKVWGHVNAYSVTSGAKLFEIQDGTYVSQQFGISCAMAGDMNGDGFEEIIVGAIGDRHDGYSAGRVDLISGRTHRVLYHFYPGEVQANFGALVRGRTDWNHDGIPDFAVYSAGHDFARGRVSIYAGNDLFLQAEPTNPAPDDSVTLAVRGGDTGALALMAIVAIDGTPTWSLFALDVLDANGELIDSEVVPPEVSGYDFTLTGYAMRSSGKIIDTGLETVSVQ